MDLDTDQFYHTDFAKGYRHFADNTVPLVVADPPYGIGYHSNRYEGRNPHAPVTNDWNFQIGHFLAETGRVLVPGGAAYVFSRWDVYPLWFPEIAGTALKLSNVIIWVKDNHSAGDLAGNFGGKYEVILFLTKGRHRRRGHRLSNVWDCPRVHHSRLLHPTEKPVDLYRRAIEASSDPGDLVIDPCCGSGTVGEAARQTGRKFVGFDVSPEMIAVAQTRLGLPVTVEPTPTPTTPSTNNPQALDPLLYDLHPDDLKDAAEFWREQKTRRIVR